MKILDLFCGAGGASKGYELAGFDNIIGIDNVKQPSYPYKLIDYDALDFLWEEDLRSFDLIHASPPCQAYSWSARQHRNKGQRFVELIGPLREILIDKRCDYVIENVVGSELINPIFLEGYMFGLPLKRRRLFECSFDCDQPELISPSDIGLPEKVFVTLAGHGGTAMSYKLSHYRLAMGIWWMNKKDIIQAIPPKYTEYIGKEYLNQRKIS